ncbi:hypothetical protein Droror1_Dr00020619 [Drosera rotundifolia]
MADGFFPSLLLVFFGWLDWAFKTCGRLESSWAWIMAWLGLQVGPQWNVQPSRFSGWMSLEWKMLGLFMNLEWNRQFVICY